MRVDQTLGLIFACLDPDVEPLEAIAGATCLSRMREPLGQPVPLEVIHFHKAIVREN